MAAKKKTAEPHFEDTLNALESLLTTMESGDLSLDESLAAFEEGIKLTRHAQKALETAQQKVELLLEDDNGELYTESTDVDGEPA